MDYQDAIRIYSDGYFAYWSGLVQIMVAREHRHRVAALVKICRYEGQRASMVVLKLYQEILSFQPT